MRSLLTLATLLLLATAPGCEDDVSNAGGPDLKQACATAADCATSLAGRFCFSGACVECLVAGDCPQGKKCVGHACAVGCDAANPCPAGQTCDVSRGICLGCMSDADCPDKAMPRCNPATHSCAACAALDDNCPAEQYCDGGACRPGCKSDSDCANKTATPRCDAAAHQCVGCLIDGHCSKGQVCVKGSCTSGCSSAQTCAMGQDCCASMCIDVTADAKNCGGCGKVCQSTQGCCGGACIDVTSDAKNCGKCGFACAPFPNAEAACAKASCVVGACAGAFKDCNGKASDGCETDTATDGGNCGACGKTCPPVPNAAPGCAMGACGLGPCAANYGDCDGAAANGCETSLLLDPAHCGKCGFPCPAVLNGKPGCAAGTCGVGSCTMGWGDCNGDPRDGCEKRLSDDAANCGKCGYSCPGGQYCRDGVCWRDATFRYEVDASDQCPATPKNPGTKNLGDTCANAGECKGGCCSCANVKKGWFGAACVNFRCADLATACTLTLQGEPLLCK